MMERSSDACTCGSSPRPGVQDRDGHRPVDVGERALRARPERDARQGRPPPPRGTRAPRASSVTPPPRGKVSTRWTGTSSAPSAARGGGKRPARPGVHQQGDLQSRAERGGHPGGLVERVAPGPLRAVPRSSRTRSVRGRERRGRGGIGGQRHPGRAAAAPSGRPRRSRTSAGSGRGGRGWPALVKVPAGAARSRRDGVRQAEAGGVEYVLKEASVQLRWSSVSKRSPEQVSRVRTSPSSSSSSSNAGNRGWFCPPRTSWGAMSRGRRPEISPSVPRAQYGHARGLLAGCRTQIPMRLYSKAESASSSAL
jgi:hypothetical protein